MRTSVGPLVTLSSKLLKNGLLRILNNLNSAGRGRKRDEEVGGAMRKQGQGERRDEQEAVTRRKERRGE